MSLRDDIWAYLSTHAGLAALIGTAASARLFPGVAPANATMPYVVVARISGEHETDLLRANNTTSQAYQFDVYDADHTAADAVAEQLRQALHGMKSGEITNVQAVEFDGERDEYLEPYEGSQFGRYVRSLDFTFWATESVPTF